MVYILFDKDTVYGIYKTLDLLKQNCFSFNYQKYNDKKTNEKEYFVVKNSLIEMVKPEIDDLRKLMLTVEIYVKITKYEENGLYALERILKHIKYRFDILEEKMSMDSRVHIKFPGNNAIENKMITHSIENNWRNLDMNNYLPIITQLRKYLITRIQNLEMKFTTRVKFGSVCDTYASEIFYQVWPADQQNWNLPENTPIQGSEFSSCFEYQTEGVFGIVTDPLYGYKDL